MQVFCFRKCMENWWPPGGLTPVSTAQNYHHQCLCPHSEPQLPPTSPGDPPRPAGRSGPSSYEKLLFPLVAVHTRLCVCPTRVEFLFPPVLWSSCDQAPLAFKAKCSGELLLLMPDIQAGELDMGLGTLIPVGKPLQYNYFPVCGLPTSWVWDLILL